MASASQNLAQMNELFKTAVMQRASDLHLLVGKPPILRIDGALRELSEWQIITHANIEELVFSVLSKEQQTKFLRQKEIDFSYELEGVSRFRVNAHFEKQNFGLIARVISSEVPTMEELSMPGVLYNLTRLNQGLILVTGPTGSGKSTSLAAMIDLINKENNKHIITLEDPIEFVFRSEKSYIRQRQMHDDFLSFGEALKHVVRQDPDIIMVGEMRDLETIAAAITVAETGHLVLATLHTLNSAQTIDRIVDVFPPHQQNQIRLQLSMELRGIVSQQLVPVKPSSSQAVNAKSGRIATREVLINNSAVANLIRENKINQINSVIQTSAQQGMVSMDQDLKRLFDEGLITKETAQHYMVNPGAFK